MSNWEFEVHITHDNSTSPKVISWEIGQRTSALIKGGQSHVIRLNKSTFFVEVFGGTIPRTYARSIVEAWMKGMVRQHDLRQYRANAIRGRNHGRR